MFTKHFQQRCQDRGTRSEFIEAILFNADVERPMGRNCRLLRVSRKRADRLNLSDRLGRYAIIWSDDIARAVTILPIESGARGARYRSKH